MRSPIAFMDRPVPLKIIPPERVPERPEAVERLGVIQGVDSETPIAQFVVVLASCEVYSRRSRQAIRKTTTGGTEELPWRPLSKRRAFPRQYFVILGQSENWQVLCPIAVKACQTN